MEKEDRASDVPGGVLVIFGCILVTASIFINLKTDKNFILFIFAGGIMAVYGFFKIISSPKKQKVASFKELHKQMQQRQCQQHQQHMLHQQQQTSPHLRTVHHQTPNPHHVIHNAYHAHVQQRHPANNFVNNQNLHGTNINYARRPNQQSHRRP